MRNFAIFAALFSVIASTAIAAEIEEKKISSDLLGAAFKKSPQICFQNASNKWDRDYTRPNQFASSVTCRGFTTYMQAEYLGWETKRYFATGGGFFYEASNWDEGESPEMITVLQSQQKEDSLSGQLGESWQCKISWKNTSKIGIQTPPEDFYCTVQCCAFEETLGQRKEPQ